MFYCLTFTTITIHSNIWVGHFIVFNFQDISNELSGESGSLTAIKCDLTKDADVLALFATIKEQFGGVDVCINNAGLSHGKNLLGKCIWT